MDLFSVFTFAVAIFGIMIQNFFVYAIPFIIALSIIVFVHEYGHFIVGRWCGVKVEVFSLGFGPEITGWFDKKGTRWRIACLPFGGYVRFKGDGNVASKPNITIEQPSADMFSSRPVWQRAAIVAAGPLANFMLAVFIFAAAFLVLGKEGITPLVGEVIPGSAAEMAGFQPGDKIVRVDGQKVQIFSDVIQRIFFRPGEEITVNVERGDQVIMLKATPREIEGPIVKGRKTRFGQLGLRVDSTAPKVVIHYGPIGALKTAVTEIHFIVDMTLAKLKQIILGQEELSQLGGAITIADFASEAAFAGIWSFVNFIALISVSIGLINLFPIPMLDGGHLVFFLIEAVFRKPVGPQIREWSFRIGFAVVVVLMLAINFLDLAVRLGG